jgi:hypothetical protein
MLGQGSMPSLSRVQQCQMLVEKVVKVCVKLLVWNLITYNYRS